MRRLFAVLALGIIGCSNPSTPAGYVGYVTKHPYTMPARFYELQTGDFNRPWLDARGHQHFGNAEYEHGAVRRSYRRARQGQPAYRVPGKELTPLYVQYEAIQAQQKMVNSPNHTEVYIPVRPMGVPIVGTVKMGQQGTE